MGIFNGDIALQPTLDGGQIEYSGGQPVMDQGGLENAVFISLFTRNGWAGNALDENSPNNQIGSDFEETVLSKPITSNTLLIVEQAVNDALQWMINVNVAVDISTIVTAPDLNTINIEILIEKPDSETVNVFYELNWMAGFFNPVNARFR